MNTIPEKQIVFRPCYHKELAEAYGVSPQVLKRWLMPYPETIRSNKKKYDLRQLAFIVEKIGFPPNPLPPKKSFSSAG